jgi:pimeloyl-ACP methyl ester carboxylesterase
MILKILYWFAGIVLVALLAVGVSVWSAHDLEYKHTEATAKLPEFSGQPGKKVSLQQIRTGEYTFRSRVAGFGGTRGNLILLHGFPETSIMWQPLLENAANAGYQVVAFDQRGYSPGARPEGRAKYKVVDLTADVLAVADAVGFDKFHLVGHDWGSAVGWSVVLQHPSRVKTWTSLSIPHIASFGEALETDPEQQRKSSYMALFWTPVLPEAILSFNDFSVLRNIMYGGHGETTKQEYMAVFREPGAMTTALNWYRAPNDANAEMGLDVDLPVLFIWGNQDPAVGRVAVDLQRQYLKGPFEEMELDAGHWLMESHPAEISNAILSHIVTHGGQQHL